MMGKPTDRIRQLLQRYFNDRCMPEEQQELALWIESVCNDAAWEKVLEAAWSQFHWEGNIDLDQADAIARHIIDNGKDRQTVRSKRKSLATPLYRFSLVAAAAIAVLLLFSIGYVYKHFGPTASEPASRHPADTGKVHPGGNKAFLVLSNGTTIALDSAQNGALAQLGGMQVTKRQSGQLVFKAKGRLPVQQDDSAEAINILRTPIGGQYQIQLPDGTKVWLNAASRLVFPTVFRGNQRRVEVRGEAYFEVRPDSKRPFVVTIQDEKGSSLGNILVRGTRFNVKAYPDEPPVTATLLAGKVKVRGTRGQGTAAQIDSGKALQLSAGQQARIGKKGEPVLCRADNPDAVIAWKNGLFVFGGISIGAVMRQLSRWYNIDVQYDDTISGHFMGTISRHAALSEVLKMLELSGKVRFTTKGRTVTVIR